MKEKSPIEELLDSSFSNDWNKFQLKRVNREFLDNVKALKFEKNKSSYKRALLNKLSSPFVPFWYKY